MTATSPLKRSLICNVAVESQYFLSSERFIASNLIRRNFKFMFMVTAQVVHSKMVV